MINYHNRKFRIINTGENSALDNETIFHYTQEKNIVQSEYSGGSIRAGQLIGIVDEQGVINMRYQQVNDRGELMTGQCISTPEILSSGKIRLYEKWKWTSGDHSEGTSILEEI